MIRSELKQQAKEQMKGNLGMIIVCTIIVMAIQIALSFIPVVGAIASMVITPALTLGMTMLYLKVTYGEGADVATLFDGFKKLGPAFILNLLISIFTMLWSLLLVVPGIIKSISYSMSFYILAENPDMTATEALNESKAIMDGHKMEAFVLGLSFILWSLLIPITFGLASLYVMPYMALTFTNFYHNIKNQQVGSYSAPVETTVENNVIQ